MEITMKLYYGVLAVVCITLGLLIAYNKTEADENMKLESSAFKHNEKIPTEYTQEGENVSPQLSWNGQPNKTHSFVIFAEDPDAPSAKNPAPKAYVHWVAFNIPANVHKLDKGAAIHALGGKEGKNSSGSTGYVGPKPPLNSGPHRYFFHVFALDKMLDLHAGVTKDEVQNAMKHHILAQGELIGIYEIK